MALPTAQSFDFRSFLKVGNEVLFSYAEPSTTLASTSASAIIQVPANTSNVAANLASLFPAFSAPSHIILHDVSSPGLGIKFSPANTGTKLSIKPNGMAVWCTNGELPTIYLDNTGNSIAYIRIIAVD